MRKVLIILYYWPPSGGGGVQRWLQFSKYLPEYGWEPIVYAPGNADYPLLDPSLEAQVPAGLTVIRHPIREIRRTFRRFMGGGQAGKEADADNIFYQDPEERSWKQNLSLWIRGNFFIPDARAGWIKPSIRFLSRYLSNHPVDAIISTGPPHSMHLIARALSAKFDLPWVADFRDPWTRIEFYDKLMLTRRADRRHHQLEREVLTTADKVISASYAWAEDFRRAGATDPVCITNGYDEENFSEDPPFLHKKFLISHIGTLANDRNPEILWQVLQKLSAELPGFGDELLLRIVGPLGSEVQDSIEEAGLSSNLEQLAYVPHAEAIRMMRESQILLLLINQAGFNAPGRIPGKVFEYLAAQRPILLIGPQEGDSAQILAKTEAGPCIAYDQDAELEAWLREAYARYGLGLLSADSVGWGAYSRKGLTESLGRVLDGVTQL